MKHNELNVTQFFWLVLIAFVVALLARRLKVPYALALVVTGVGIGIPRLLPQAHLEPSLLFTVFLPPLLFEAALNLPVEALRRDWRPILVYTLGGTLLSTLLVGHLVAWLLGMPLVVAMVFGSLISATDPIAVLGIFKRLGAGRRLTLIMEAESIFNDGVAVVLFTVTLALAAGHGVSFGSGVWQFCRLMFGGLALGAGIGALAARVHYELSDHLIEITLTSLVAFGSYLCAEALHVSGVMAVVAAGMVIGSYGMSAAMTPGTRLAVTAFWEYAGFVANSLVFLLVGIEVAYVRWTDKIGIVLVSILAVLIGRSVIYPLSWLVNRMKGHVPRAWQHILVWGGLRGALSMALVLGLERDFPQRDTLVAATFGVVVFSLLGQGLTIGPLLKKLNVAGAQESEDSDKISRLRSEIVACQAAVLELERIRLMEAHPTWAMELMLREYQGRLELLESRMIALQPDYRNSTVYQTYQVRQAALMAEKSGFQEAVRQGWLADSDWQQITLRLDAELIALQEKMPAS